MQYRPARRTFEAIEEAIALIQRKEERFTCNALTITSADYNFVDKYKLFSIRNGTPPWWNDGREWHTEARIAALRAFANSL